MLLGGEPAWKGRKAKRNGRKRWGGGGGSYYVICIQRWIMCGCTYGSFETIQSEKKQETNKRERERGNMCGAFGFRLRKEI